MKTFTHLTSVSDKTQTDKIVFGSIKHTVCDWVLQFMWRFGSLKGPLGV